MTEALIIDDNRSTADALLQMLGLLKVPARVAYGSSAALALLGSFTPGLILLDITMPGVDGIEVLGFLRREPRLAPVPVLVITLDDQPETRERAFRGGANGMIIKPATLDVLEENLRRLGDDKDLGQAGGARCQRRINARSSDRACRRNGAKCPRTHPSGHDGTGL